MNIQKYLVNPILAFRYCTTLGSFNLRAWRNLVMICIGLASAIGCRNRDENAITPVILAQDSATKQQVVCFFLNRDLEELGLSPESGAAIIRKATDGIMGRVAEIAAEMIVGEKPRAVPRDDDAFTENEWRLLERGVFVEIRDPAMETSDRYVFKLSRPNAAKQDSADLPVPKVNSRFDWRLPSGD